MRAGAEDDVGPRIHDGASEPAESRRGALDHVWAPVERDDHQVRPRRAARAIPSGTGPSDGSSVAIGM